MSVRKTVARRYVRFTRWRRAHFFRMLEKTGHVQMAAEAAGISSHCIYRLRRVEPGFVERMDEAREKADARLRGEVGERAFGGGKEGGPRIKSGVTEVEEGLAGEGEGGVVIRRGVGGRLRAVAAGPRWWTDRHDALFLARLRVTGNVAASARSAGFTPKSAWNRRRRLQSFARAWDEALEEAEIRLECRIVEEAYKGTPAMCRGAFEVEEPERFDPWLALWYLKWREGRSSGRIRPRPRRQRPVEDVMDTLLRQIEAIERHRGRFGPEQGEDGVDAPGARRHKGSNGR